MLQAEGAPRAQAENRRCLVHHGKSREAERHVQGKHRRARLCRSWKGRGPFGKEGEVIARFSADEQHGLSYLLKGLLYLLC